MATAPVQWMVEGYFRAIERLLGTIRSGDAGDKETFLPLFEALNWAASIDEFLVDKRRPIQDELLTGVGFARNRVHHQWGLALRRNDSPGVPMVLRATGLQKRGRESLFCAFAERGGRARGGVATGRGRV